MLKHLTDKTFSSFIPRTLCNYNSGDGTGTGGGSSTADLIESLAANASSAYQTSVIANANPLNAALITGGAAQTAQGSTVAGTFGSASLGGSTGLLLLIVAAVVILFAVKK